MLVVRGCLKPLRQTRGGKKGNSPLKPATRLEFILIQQDTELNEQVYFLEGVAAGPEPRMALKKSDDGSTTITSLFLLKADL